MTVTTTRTPRTTFVLRRNECIQPRINPGTRDLWENLWFGAGGTGTNSSQGTELDKSWSNTPTSMEDAGWSYLHNGWSGDWTEKTCSAYLYPSGFEPKAAVKAQYFNSSGGLIYYDTGPITQLFLGSTSGWQRIAGTFKCPPGTAFVRVRYVLMPGNNAQSGQGLAIQRALIEPGSTLSPYFDGTTYAAGNGTQSTTWAGTADNSQSYLWDWNPADVQSPQLVLGYDVAQASRNVVHQLIDGPVAATLLPASGRQGTLRLFFLDATSAEQARVQHAAATAWVYADTDQPQEAMTYVVDGQVRKYQTDNRLRWVVEVPYRELI